MTGKLTGAERKRYRIICPYCGRVQYACKSMLHEMGYNEAGCGICMECRKFMKLAYSPESDTMTAGEWKTAGTEREGGFFG